MPSFVLTDPSGKEWDVEAPDVETATKEFGKFRQGQANEQLINEANTMPEWAKPFAAARDVATVGADALTFGFGTKAAKGLFGGEPEMDVAARRNRMGWAAPALDVGLMAGALPTAVPKIIAKMGGGPAARAIVGTGAAAAEGGAVGGLEAAGHDQDTSTGIVTGMLGGAAGQQVAPVINKAYKAVRGIDDVPKGIRSGMTVLPSNPSAADKVTVASNEAISRARTSDDPLAYQNIVKGNIEGLLRKDKKSFTPAQKEIMERVVNEDPATKAARIGGDVLSDKLTLGGAGVGAGFASANPLIGLLATGGLAGAGRALKEVSKGGTKEAMDDLLRAMAKKKKYEGLLSAQTGGQIMKGSREGLLDLLEDY